MATGETFDFEPAQRLAKDRARVRKDFWRKLKRVAAQLPFAEDLLAAYYCAFDRQTPRHVQMALLGAIAYFILPFDFIPECCRFWDSPTMPRCSRPRFVPWPATFAPITATPRAPRLRAGWRKTMRRER